MSTVFVNLFVGHWMQGDFGHDRKNVSLLVKSFYEVFKDKSQKPALILKASIGIASYISRDEILFCNAVENLIKNGLTYNDSSEKMVKIYLEEESIVVEDNGRGFSQKQFEKQLKKYASKQEASEDEKGLGLNICVAILEEHGFKLTCEKIDTGTKMKIKIKEEKHD